MPNQFGLDHFDWADAYGTQEENLCPADLKDFVEKNHLALDQGDSFNPRLAFGSHADADHIYNTPRGWFIARYFLPRTYRWDGDNADFTPESNDIPWSFVPERKVAVEDVRYLLGSYYQGTPYDPYGKDPIYKGRYRTIGVPNSDVCGIMQIRGYLPEAVQGVQWLSMGGSGFTACFPVYAHVPQFPKYISGTTETVSTDFDTGDRLYFDPLNPESVDNIIATEKPDACVVQFGGQTAIKLAKHMDEIGLPILGTPADAIDEAEDRERFDELLERCNIPRAPGRTVFNLDEALAAAEEIGLPVLMRPSYVLGGQNMIVAYNKADIIEYMGVITEHVDMDHPVLLDKYIMGTECEVDAICDGENFLIPGIMEQVERTGVHSGDSICVYPAQHLTQDEIDTMVDYTGRFARELHVTGLVNVQYAVSHGRVYVIEVNPRSSRTVPYISKVTGVPMVDMAVRCCLGEKLTDMGYGTGLHPNAPYVAVKVPVFSFEKLHAVDTQFGPEMKSTGEVLGIAPNYHDALLKGLIGAGYTFKTPGPGSCCIFTVKDSDKPEFVDIAWKLKDMGYKLYGTSGTCAWLNKHMVPCNEVRNISGEAPNIVDLLQSGLVDYVFYSSAKGRDPRRDSVRLRRKAVELSIPCITAVDTAASLVDCLRSEHSLANIPLVDIATLYRGK